MRAAIYNPYLDTLGGGERYTCAFAEVLARKGYSVDMQWKDLGIKRILANRFGINLDGVNIVKDIKRGDGYDMCFWVSDGSIPILHARNNILHFQVPFHGVGGKSLINKMKLFRINKIICNSEFTKRIIDKEYGVESLVIYPPVDTSSIRPKRKENTILFVGRFSQILQTKSQDVLVRAFRKLYDEGFKEWKLILAGGTEVGVGEFVEKLRNMSEGYPVEIIESPDYKILKDLYGKARIFWSASGYEQDEDKYPQKVEHFGITAVEAMAGGTVPIVYAAGGHKETVKENVNGFLWVNIGGLISKTKKVITDKKLCRRLSLQAQKDSLTFSLEKFREKVLVLV